MTFDGKLAKSYNQTVPLGVSLYHAQGLPNVQSSHRAAAASFS